MTDTYFVVAHFHYVMMGGTVIAMLGGFHYWWPKMFGRMYPEKISRVGWFFVFVGFNVLFLPQFWLGSHGMPRRYYNYPAQFQTLHQISTVGSWIVLIGFLIHTVALIWSIKYGEKAPANPWGGKTLEWMTESPPNVHNFHEIPVVDSFPYEFKPEKV